ncbi:MAG: sigma-70 family RNA polymerase sigma factor [Chloroflexota bacterium]
MTVMFRRTMVCPPHRTMNYEQKTATPALSEIMVFRLAFAGDTDAWAILHTRYISLIRCWIGRQHLVDPEEVAQEAWLAFARYAPRQPSLVEDDSPARVLAYLRTCVKTAIISMCRREQRCVVADPLSDHNVLKQSPRIDNSIVQRITIQERIQQILTSDDERLLFELRFVCGMKPQAISNTYPNQFADVQMVYTLIHAIVRRLRADPILQSLRLSTSEMCV